MFDWKPAYSVGHSTIDSQHQRLFALCSELHAAMMKGKSRDVLGKTLVELLAYTKTHFAAEEGIMRATAYPDLARHMGLHREFTRRIDAVVAEYQAGRMVMTPQLLAFLREWLTHHISIEDQRVAAGASRAA